MKEALLSANQKDIYDAYSRILISWIKSVAQKYNGILEVLIDDIYDDIKMRDDCHPNMLLKIITYFQHNGYRERDGFNMLKIILSHMEGSILPSELVYAIGSTSHIPSHIPLDRNCNRISMVQALADEVAQLLCQSGVPSDYTNKKAWKLNLQLPYAMPYDTMKEEWIESFYLSEDGKIIISSTVSPLLPIDFGSWVELDFVGLTEHLQWSSSFKWEKDSGEGEWAYPIADSFISASEAAGKIMSALNTLKDGIEKRKEAEERRKTDEAGSMLKYRTG